jgi:MerR family transcriptional regulator, thiopeptide resistance regulator
MGMNEATARQRGAVTYSVGELAELTHVSVRTLHHYDRIGLLRPDGRSAAGYRHYGPAELARLRRILFYRALDFGLDRIAELLDDPDTNAEQHLREQHRLLRGRIERDHELLAAVERELEATRMGISLTPEEQFEVFGTDKVGGEWADEAAERWGATDPYRESQRRASHYTKADWVAIKAEADAGLQAFASAMRSGSPADGDVAMDLAEEHRRYLSRWFYDCSYDLHRGLARMYVADPRFTQTYDLVAPGLAQYVHDAILANADRAEAASS